MSTSESERAIRITPRTLNASETSYETSCAHVFYLLAAPMAAALGAGVPASERGGKLVIDIGAGTTDVAIVTLSGVVHARTMRMGGAQLDEAVRAWLKRKLDVEVGLPQARALKEQLGSALARQDLRDVCIDARDRVTGALRVVRVRAEELREALAPAVAQLVDAVRIVIEDAPPELSADIAQNGIVLAGGGARLDGLAALLMRELRLPVAVAKDPQTAGVTGCGATPRPLRPAARPAARSAGPDPPAGVRRRLDVRACGPPRPVSGALVAQRA